MWKAKVLVTQLCLTLCDPLDYSPPGSSAHGILQASILEWVAIHFSSGSSWPRDWNQVSCIAGEFFIAWATRESPNMVTQIHMRLDIDLSVWWDTNLCIVGYKTYAHLHTDIYSWLWGLSCKTSQQKTPNTFWAAHTKCESKENKRILSFYKKTKSEAFVHSTEMMTNLYWVINQFFTMLIFA